MPKKIDVTQVDAATAKRILRDREYKAKQYALRKEEICARHREWQKNNPDKMREMARQWREANPERKAASTRAAYERNREAVLARQAERDRQLCDATVKSRFCVHTDLQSKDVPDELVPVIRTSMLIRRELRQKGKK